jgi:type II secretion system protein H
MTLRIGNKGSDAGTALRPGPSGPTGAAGGSDRIIAGPRIPPVCERSGCSRGAPVGAFTLIELILVMALLVIVIGVAMPSLKGFFQGRNLDSEARRFLSLTRYGQSRAVSEGVPMVLWMDPKQRTYGLQEESAYTEVDNKAVNFELGKDLDIEVADVPVQSGVLGQTQPAGRNLPMIRFLPDGFISEISPQSVLLREQNSGELVRIAQDRSRLNYAIQTNMWRNARR